MRKKGLSTAGQHTPGSPYVPVMSSCSGVYRIECGPSFLVGSTSVLGPRLSDHRLKLQRGEHPNAELQMEYVLSGGEFRAFLVVEVPRKRSDSDKDLRQRLRLHEQWTLNEVFGTPGCVNLSPDSGFVENASETMKIRWQDPAFRSKVLAGIAASPKRAAGLSDATREKMAEAKRGKKNRFSRKCLVGLGTEEAGGWKSFSSVGEAGRAFGVSQQAMEAWLTGRTPWPATGSKTRYPHLAGLGGRYLDAGKKRKPGVSGA